MSKQYLNVTYRDIAKMLATALPVEGEDFRECVESNLEAVKAMPAEAKTALKVAYVFSRKVPREEREDMFQDLALTLFKAKTREEKLAYAIARCDWLDWWKKQYSKLVLTCGYSGKPLDRHYSSCTVSGKPSKSCKDCPYAGKVRELVSIDTVIEDTEGNATTLANMLVGEVEFERKLNGKMDAERMFDKLPADIKPLIERRLMGQPLTKSAERMRIKRWVKAEGYKLLLAN